MQSGIQLQLSRFSVDETVTRLMDLFDQKGIRLFCVIDHSGEAAAVGMPMPSTKLLIFGSPRAGTPLMLAAPSAGLDLPLKILVAEMADGNTQMSWNDADWLQQRHGFPAELSANIAVAGILAKQAAK